MWPNEISASGRSNTRLTQCAHGGLKFCDRGIGGDPATLDMKFGAEPIILLKNGEQVACEVIQILVVELTNNRAVHRNVAGVLWARAVNKDVTGMHISVKKTVAKYLSEKNLHPPLRQ